MIGLGFLLVDVLLPIHAIGHDDEAVNEWLASNRSSSLSDASYVGSMIGDIPFIPALVIVTALGAAILRRWRVFAFIVGAILVEIATYRVTSLLVHRERPTVPRLDPEHLPVNQSFPSGHVAASVVVYVGLALLISARVRDRRLMIPVWIARDRTSADRRRVADVPGHASPDRRRLRSPDGTRGAGHRAVRRACGR